jgi:hypothetical protein
MPVNSDHGAGTYAPNRKLLAELTIICMYLVYCPDTQAHYFNTANGQYTGGLFSATRDVSPVTDERFRIAMDRRGKRGFSPIVSICSSHDSAGRIHWKIFTIWSAHTWKRRRASSSLRIDACYWNGSVCDGRRPVFHWKIRTRQQPCSLEQYFRWKQ